MKTKSGKIQVAIRITKEIAARLDALAPIIGQTELLQAAGSTVTRATIIRLAIMRGLDSLEEDFQPPRGFNAGYDPGPPPVTDDDVPF